MPRPRPQLLPDGGGDAVSNADWAESYLILGELPRLSRAELREQFRGAADDDPDLQIDLLLSEVRRREIVLGDRYPFRREGTGIARRAGKTSEEYDFLVLASFSPEFRKNAKRLARADLLFDDIVRDAARRYLGEGAQAVRFGSPASEGRPKNFPDAVAWLGDLMGIKKGPGVPLPRSRDGGLDVAAWRNFRDKRTGFVVFMLQATLQPHDKWVRKGTDVIEGRWFGWLDLGRPPVTGIAVPYAIGQSYALWDDLRRTVTVVLDRLRLIELLPASLSDAQRAKWIEEERSATGM